MRRIIPYFLLTLCSLLPLSAQTYPAPTESPKAVIGIVIDQLRSDYVEKFWDLYGNDGFRRLWKEGALFSNVSAGFVDADRSSGTATVYSGTMPCYHGIIGNRWLDRKTLKTRSCVDDASVKGIHTSECTSPASLLVTTLTDELKIATGGHSLVYSLAPERDMAVLAAGHAADAALWLFEGNAMWAGTTCYGEQPSWVSTYNHRAGTSFDFKTIRWTPYYQLAVYHSSSYDAEPEAFCHTFNEKNVRRYKTSAIVNDEVTQIAKNFITNTSLGRDRVPDMLCIGYYAGNYDHQTEFYGNIELQDIYCRLDRNLAELLSLIDERIGLDNTLLFVTSTGYVDAPQTLTTNYNLPGGELPMERCSVLLNMYLGAQHGTGDWVEATYRNHLFLNHDLIEKKQLGLRQMQDNCADFLGQMNGVSRVRTSSSLATCGDGDQLRRAFHDERSGDIVVEAAPGWTVVDERWNERVNTSRTRVPVPVVFFGAGIQPQKNSGATTLDIVAPTVASILRIPAPNGCDTPPSVIQRDK